MEYEARFRRLLGQNLRLASDQEVAKRTAELEAQQREARTHAFRSRWNAPPRHAQATPSREGPWGKHLAAVEARLGNGVTLAFVGPRRTGKTQMAVELMKSVTANGKEAVYRTATELLMRFKATYREGSKETELDVVYAHRRPALLVIDEYSHRAQNDWEDLLFFELLNQRYADLTDTVLICNLSRADCEEWLGPSLNRRIAEGGGLIEFAWVGMP